MKERHAWNSHADKISGKTTKVEFILNGLKLEQRVTIEGKENSADVCKRDDDRPIFAQIACNKNITDNRHFKEKISKTYAEARHMQKQCKVLEHQNLVGKFLNS